MAILCEKCARKREQHPNDYCKEFVDTNEPSIYIPKGSPVESVFDVFEGKAIPCSKCGAILQFKPGSHVHIKGGQSYCSDCYKEV